MHNHLVFKGSGANLNLNLQTTVFGQQQASGISHPLQTSAQFDLLDNDTTQHRQGRPLRLGQLSWNMVYDTEGSQSMAISRDQWSAGIKTNVGGFQD